MFRWLVMLFLNGAALFLHQFVVRFDYHCEFVCGGLGGFGAGDREYIGTTGAHVAYLPAAYPDLGPVLVRYQCRYIRPDSLFYRWL